MSARTAILLLMLILALAACGQKGPLFLPDEADAPSEAETADPDTPGID
ncbi:hypothetical protein BH24PSE2_BH24PSE2_05010 [soil metagenome]